MNIQKQEIRKPMNKNSKSTSVRGFRILAIVLFLPAALVLLAQNVVFPPWPVPDEANDIENPIAPDKISIEEGMAFYNINCKACHGDRGEGDGVIPAASLVSKQVLDQTDGALFYKLLEGRGQMPSFRAVSETELWNVINYIRDMAGPKEDIVRKNATIKVVFNETDTLNEIMAQVWELQDDSTEIPAGEMKMGFYVKRYFGELKIGGDRTYTNKEGKVTITFPPDLPGENKDGSLTVIIRLEDMEFNPLEVSETLQWGTPKETYWTDKRVLWKNNDYVPLWLLVSFGGVTGGIWLVIIIVMLQLKKIHDMNRRKKTA